MGQGRSPFSFRFPEIWVEPVCGDQAYEAGVVPWLNWIEQPPPKGQVAGSNPAGITIHPKGGATRGSTALVGWSGPQAHR